MKPLGTKVLETPRLWLRPFRSGDGGAIFRNWASSEAVTRFLSWPAHASPAVSEEVAQDWERQYPDPTFYQWAIVPKNLGEPIGSISVVSQRADAKTAEVGYCIGETWWHQGITREALAAVLDFLLGEVGFERVEARHNLQNPRSGQVMQACGMQPEGVLRRAFCDNQGIGDFRIYSLLAAEWRAANTKNR